MTARRPNVLLITTDQQRADHLGCYGNGVLRTPHIDSLGAGGTCFDSCYVAAPVCMPNRGTLMTGRMPSAHGMRCNGLDLPLDSVTVADLLAAAGWRTALVGKGHLQCVTGRPPLVRPDTGRSPPPSRDLAEARRADGGFYEQENRKRWRDDPDHDVRLPYYGFQTVDLAIEHGDEVEGHYSRWLAQRHPDPDSLRGPKNALPAEGLVVADAWRTAVPEALYSTSYIAERTKARLGEFARTPEEPFFLWCSFCDPHHPFTPPGRYWDLYDPADVDLPESFHACPAAFSSLETHLRHERDRGAETDNGTAAYAVTERQARQAIALTYGMIAMVDDAIGAILNRLNELGLADTTIVIFTSDHGDLMGDHQLLLKGPHHYQGLIRVPLIWRDPRMQGCGRSDLLCGTIDLAPSILDVCGVAPFNGMQGVPILDAEGRVVPWLRDDLLIEDESQRCLPGTGIRTRLRTLVSHDWRMTVYDGLEEGELYDLRHDPLELNNLWSDQAARSRRFELMERLARQMMAATDTSPLPRYAA